MRLNFGKVLADDSTPSQNLKSPAWSQLWLAVFRVCVEGEQRRFEPDLSSGCLTISILVCWMRLNFGKVLADDSTPSARIEHRRRGVKRELSFIDLHM